MEGDQDKKGPPPLARAGKGHAFRKRRGASLFGLREREKTRPKMANARALAGMNAASGLGMASRSTPRFSAALRTNERCSRARLRVSSLLHRHASRSARGLSEASLTTRRGTAAVTRKSVACAASSTADSGSKGGLSNNFVTAGYIALWYAVNVCFNLTNKTLYKSFPFPWTVSTVHVIVGSIYCLVCYALGFKKASFGRPITGEELKKISGPASMHAFGHIAANLSFAAVAISLTHTVKTLEPAFSAVLQWSILGTPTPLPVLGR